MREDPQLDLGKIASMLESGYGLDVAAVHYLPIGYDLNAAVYDVVVTSGARYFLKVRFGPVPEPSLLAPRALADLGIGQVVAPILNRAGQAWTPMPDADGQSAVLYPFIHGNNAKLIGLTEAQWREFGETLRAVHDSQLDKLFREQISVEDFRLPSAANLRDILADAHNRRFQSDAATKFAVFLTTRVATIEKMLARAEELGSKLQNEELELVLCHADIHTANIMVGADGRIHLIDWDGPKVAPRERDLLFVIGSRIGRVVSPREEASFFEGYGPVLVHPDALIYFRYERIIEDLGEMGMHIFRNPGLGEMARADAAERATGMFASGGAIDRVEIPVSDWWPDPGA